MPTAKRVARIGEDFQLAEEFAALFDSSETEITAFANFAVNFHFPLPSKIGRHRARLVTCTGKVSLSAFSHVVASDTKLLMRFCRCV